MKAQVTDAGKTRVILTRSKRGNAELAGRLRALGFEPVEVETIEFLPPADWSAVDANLKSLRRFDWVVFTSATGVEFFAARMRALSISLSWSGGPAVAAVGQKTAAALRREGVKVDFVPSSYLTRTLASELPKGSGKRVLAMRADIGEPKFVPTLERRGFTVKDLTIYRTVQVPGESTEEGADAIVFASPSAVEAFMKRHLSAKSASDLRGMLAVCIGPVTAAAARERGFERVVVSETHTTEGLLECLLRTAREAS